LAQSVDLALNRIVPALRSILLERGKRLLRSGKIARLKALLELVELGLHPLRLALLGCDIAGSRSGIDIADHR
jgi:hypothetical protein